MIKKCRFYSKHKECTKAPLDMLSDHDIEADEHKL